MVSNTEIPLAGISEPSDVNLRTLYDPDPIAVVGASATDGKLGHEAMKNVGDRLDEPEAIVEVDVNSVLSTTDGAGTLDAPVLSDEDGGTDEGP